LRHAACDSKHIGSLSLI